MQQATGVYLCSPSPVQVTLLDINETAGKTLEEALNKQYGEKRSLFFKCNVQSEEQIKGKVYTKKTGDFFCGNITVFNNITIRETHYSHDTKKLQPKII